MHGVAVTRTDAVRMDLRRTTADVDACETMVNADVFTSLHSNPFA
jgi:hypothetical protein